MSQKINKELSEKLREVARLQSQKSKKSYTATLEKLLANKIEFQEELKSIIKTQLKPIILKSKKEALSSKPPGNREIVCVLNDMHYGLFVYPQEVNNLNSYGWTEASRRTAAVIKQAITFKPHNRDEVSKCHLIINGDVLSGCIHGVNTKQQDLMINQINGSTHILAHAIGALAKEFKQVVVHATGGNHENFVHKREGGRVITETYDSFASIIFYSLSCIFKDVKHVSFNVSHSPTLFVDLPGGRALVTHGDILFSKELGNPGRTINVKGLSDSLHRFSLGEMSRGKPAIKLALFGHVHCVPDTYEVLTEHRGFINIKDVNIGERVVGYKNGKNVYSKVFDKTFGYHNGTMYDFNSVLINQQVTDGHYMYTKDDEYLPLSKHLTKLKLKDLVSSAIPLQDDKPNQYDPNFLRFLVAASADGHFSKVKGEINDIRFHFRKQRKIDRLQQIMDSLGYPIKFSKQSDGTTKNLVLPKELVYKVYQLIPDKRISKWMTKLNSTERQIIIDELIFWDGSQCSVKTRQFCSTRKDELDNVQELLVLNGYKTRVYKGNTIAFSKFDYMPGTGALSRCATKKEVTNFPVACLSTETKNFYIRTDKNSSTELTGNSRASFITNDGIQVEVAPSLSGLDGYAYSLGINNNFTGQLIFESVPKHIIGDSRLIICHNSDKDKTLDALIPVFKKGLKYE